MAWRQTGCKAADKYLVLSGSLVLAPVDETHSAAFLIGIGTLNLTWNATFQLHTSADDSAGNYTQTPSKINIHWNLHKMFSYNQKPTTLGNVANFPFEVIFGSILGGSKNWIDGDWDDTVTVLAEVYQDPGFPASTKPTTQP